MVAVDLVHSASSPAHTQCKFKYVILGKILHQIIEPKSQKRNNVLTMRSFDSVSVFI